MNPPNGRPWRRYVRFSVRGLVIAVLVIGGWLGWIAHRARVQREAVAAIKRAGGHVYYDWERNDGKPVPNGKPRWPRWLVDRLGIDYFGDVDTVFLWNAGSRRNRDAL